MRRALVTSWCSFDEVIATVGDERSVEVVAGWLGGAGVQHDVAWAAYLGRGPAPAELDPAAYTDLVFVCGPLLAAPPLTSLLDRFSRCRRTAVGVSVVDPGVAARFHTVLPRDGAGVSRPDLAATPAPPASTVVATVHAPRQPEYGAAGRHDAVRAGIARWIADRGLGWFDVETDVWTPDRTVRHASQVTAALARADVVVTSRLHGLVLGRAAGRPVVAVDPVAGGAKVTAQAAALGWPVVVAAEDLDPAVLDAALERCLAPGLGSEPVTADVVGALGRVRAELLGSLRSRG